MKQHSMTTKPKVPPPQKPVNAFFLFQQYKKQAVIQANPGKKFAEITKLLSQAYKELPTVEKKMYADLAAADRARYQKEREEYTEKCKIFAQKRTKSLPTDDEEEYKPTDDDDDDDDEEYEEKPPKKTKVGNAKKTKKGTYGKENKMKVEVAAESIPRSNHRNSYLCRNSLNRVCFVEIDESTGIETLVPALDTLNEIANSIPEAKLDPELRHKIELARQEDKEDIENGKGKGKSKFMIR